MPAIEISTKRGKVKVDVDESGKVTVDTPNEVEISSNAPRPVLVNKKETNTLLLKELAKKEINTLVKKSERKLLEVKSVFPFDFFPDRVVVDDQKVNLVFGLFLFSDHVFPIQYKDLRSITVTTGLFFGSLFFDVQGFEENPQRVNFLWREDAIRARRIIMGLLVAAREGIDLSKLPTDELVGKANTIGAARPEYIK